jgi:hypothetical protein
MDDLIERLERGVEVAPLERVDVEALRTRARTRATVRTVGGLVAGVLLIVVAGFVIGPLLGRSVQIDDPVATAPGTEAPSMAPPTLPEGASFLARVADVGDVTGIFARDAEGDLSLQGTARLIGRGMAPFELRYAVDHADTLADVLGLWERFGITGGRPDDVHFQWNEKVVFVMVMGDGCPSSVGFDVVDFPAGDTLQLVTGHAEEEAVCDLVGTFQTFALAVDRTKSPLPAVQRIVAPAGAGVDRDHLVDFGVRGQDPDWPSVEVPAAASCAIVYSNEALASRDLVIDATIVDVDLDGVNEDGDQRIRLGMVVHEWLRGDGPAEVDVMTWSFDDSETFPIGARLLLAPGTNVDGTLQMSACGFSRPYSVAQADEWIEWIHGAP